ncbi:MAG: hypothetical protein HY672_00495 [Chloroflexi bacterium]|nr:hypothetical protein [Chloroflexota bacterium]
MNTDDSAFQVVFQEEMAQWIIPRRRRESPPGASDTSPDGYHPRVDNGLVGLALSGGGIRAATFALGVLQRLGRLGILRFVDILSTASGGGYLGASWSSLTADSPVKSGPGSNPSGSAAPGALGADGYEYGSGINNFPFKFVGNAENPDRQIFDRESDAVRHLRAHGNWLAPHIGLFDVWTWVAITRYVVSTVINLALIPVPWVLGVMGLTMLVPQEWWDRQTPLESPIAFYMWVVPLLLFAVFSLFIWARTPKVSISGSEIKHPLYWLQKTSLVLAIGWIVAALFILALGFLYTKLPGILAEMTGLSLATLIGVAGAIYRFFGGEVSGGVANRKGDGLKKAAGFLLGIAGYLALGGLFLATYYALDSSFFSDLLERRPIPKGVIFMTAGAFAVAAGMLFMPVRRFLNFFSLQALYRRGLRKAYILRAVREEEARGSGDDVVPRGREEFLLSELKKGDEPPDMPYHLIGTAINTSGDTQLQRLGRKSDGFVLAHLYSGSRVTRYWPTATSRALKGMSLSEAMAISGAAQSPNMGHATTTSMAILMALFNVRIGSWIHNPNEDAQGRRTWRPLVWFWLKELFGAASAEDRYVYLTDGGHFDNSGIYELLKRRCKYILAVDASADIGNLATVARLARIDLGVQIDINLEPLKYGSPAKLSEQAFVVGRVKYSSVQDDSETDGVLVWIPTVMTRGQKPDVVRYAEEDSVFPFHPTGDQFYDQVQFEAYRQLGHTAVGIAFPDRLVEKEPITRGSLEQVLEDMLKQAPTQLAR